MKKMDEARGRENKSARRQISELKAELAVLQEHIRNLHEEAYFLNDHNVELLKNSIRYRAAWIEADHRNAQLNRALEYHNIEAPFHESAQLQTDRMPSPSTGSQDIIDISDGEVEVKRSLVTHKRKRI
jgi:hypothetical protein